MAKTKVTIPSMKELLEAGVHFGHQSRRWNPKMTSYIFAKKKGIHIFDLAITREKLQEASKALADIASQGRPIIFLCTKRQTKQLVANSASEIGELYVSNRWLGGTLTNFETVQKSLKKYKDLREGLESGKFNNLKKKERVMLKRKKERLDRLYGGVAELEELPSALVVIDPKREKTAVREAIIKNIPVIALTDSNCDPAGISYVIPGNDDAYRSVKIILKVLIDSVVQGRALVKKPTPESDESVVEESEGKSPKARTAVTPSDVLAEKTTAPKVKDVKAKTGLSKDQESQGRGKLESLGLSKRSFNALLKSGVDTIDALVELTEEELDNVKGLGKKSLGEIRDKLS